MCRQRAECRKEIASAEKALKQVLGPVAWEQKCKAVAEADEAKRLSQKKAGCFGHGGLRCHETDGGSTGCMNFGNAANPGGRCNGCFPGYALQAQALRTAKAAQADEAKKMRELRHLRKVSRVAAARVKVRTAACHPDSPFKNSRVES